MEKVKIKVYCLPVRRYWEGDELRGGDNVRSDIFMENYITESDYELLEGTKEWNDIFKEVAIEKYGSWTDFVGALDSEDPEYTTKIINKINDEVKNRIKKEYEFEVIKYDEIPDELQEVELRRLESTKKRYAT